MPNQYVRKATRYIEDVLSGAIPACKFVRQACERQKKDLEREGFPFVFDPERAFAICAFVEMMPHVKGEWAKKRLLITLEGWQCFLLTTLFGWVDENGNRRFNRLYAEIPRKNGKSLLLSAIGNYMLIADEEEGAEIFCGAGNMEQALVVFEPARKMMMRVDDLARDVGVTVNKRSLVIEETNSFFRPVIGKPGDGDSPHCGIVDEYHEHPDSTQFDAFETGMGSRAQPLLAVITTAGIDMAGPCYSYRNLCSKILNGDIENDRIFCIIFSIDEDDDWTDFETWIKANPNCGISVRREFLLAQYTTAMQDARRQNILRTKHLNVWCGTNVAWLNIARWDAGKDESLRMEDFRTEECYIGVDLATKTDIASVVYVFIRGVDYYVFVDKYLPEDTIELAENQHYREWRNQGLLKQTDGAVTDFDRIEEDIVANAAVYNVQELCYDSWKASHLEQHLTKRGMTCIEIRQGTATMSEPMKTVEALILQGRIHHDGDPVMRWMMGNVVAYEDFKGNIFPRKDHAANKIDGAVALINAFVRALVDTKHVSIYEQGTGL